MQLKSNVPNQKIPSVLFLLESQTEETSNLSKLISY